METSSRFTARAVSSPTSAVNSAGADPVSAVSAGAGNQTSRVVPLEIVAIPWPDAMVVLS